MANLEDAVSEEETPIKRNNRKRSRRTKFLRNMTYFAFKFRKEHEHLSGAIASFYIGSLGPKAQRKYAKLWGVSDAYFTKWQTTFWYGASFLYEHAPLFATSNVLDYFTGVNEGNYVVLGNLAVGTGTNIARAIAAFKFNKPFPSINIQFLVFQGIHYWKPIKEFAIKKIQNLQRRND